MSRIGMQELIEKLIALAVKKGAQPDLIKPISTDQVVIPDQWPRWKCKFGCDNYGNRLCCPPFVPSPDETRKFIKEYKQALLVGFPGDPDIQNFAKHHNRMTRALVKLEAEAFKSNYPKALVLSAGTCYLCRECILKDLPKTIHPEVAKRFCRHKNLMRASMEAVGIDVFGTVKKAGLRIEVITEDNLEMTRHFGLLLIE